MLTIEWTIRYADSVVSNDLPALDHTAKQRIRKAVETKLALDPMHFGKPLRYSLFNFRSLRVGDYRVLYHIDHEHHLISISAIGHRSEIYED